MKGLVILSNVCEDVEAIGTIALLRRAGLEIVTATFNDDKKVTCAYNTKVEAEEFIENLNLDEFDFLVIPGGSYVVKTYDTDKNIKNIILEFNSKNKLIAAICAGPMFLGEAGLLKEKHYTVFPGCEKESFGGILQQYHKVVKDGNLITARSVGALFDFSYEIIKYLKGYEKAEEFLKDIYF